MSIWTDTDWDRLTRYLAGEGNSAERAQVAQWLDADPARQTAFADVQCAWQMVHSREFPSPSPAQWEALRSQLQRSQVSPRLQTQPRRTWPRGGWIAALSLAVVGFAVIGRMIPWSQALSQQVTSVYHTNAGQRATVRLTAHAIAILGPATRLTVTTQHASTAVTVAGEAFFTVAHDSHAPLTVQAGHVITRVLGTAFAVRKYAADPVTQVVVTEGRVAVHAISPGNDQKNSSHAVVLAARTLGAIDDSGHVTVTPNVAIDDYTAWTTGQLVFHKTPVATVITELSRAYGVDLRLADSALADHALTFTVPVTTHSLDDVLRTLVLTLDAHYITQTTRTGRVVVIAPGRTAERRPIAPITEDSYHGK